MQKWFADLIVGMSNCDKSVKKNHSQSKKSYVQRDNSKKNRTKNINHARKAKFIRQGR